MNEKLKTDWIINGLMAVILVLLVGNYMNGSAKNAYAAGDGGGWGTNGIMVGTTGANERLVLVDTNKQNIMIYRSRAGGGMGLTGARSYKYDIEMEDTGTTKIKNGGMTFFDTALAWAKRQK